MPCTASIAKAKPWTPGSESRPWARRRPTYRAWRQVAAARVRAKDLPGALDAYRQCERRAPASDKVLIASRLGLALQRDGQHPCRGAATSRAAAATALPSFMTYLIIGATVVTSPDRDAGRGRSCRASTTPAGPLELQLELNKYLVASGEDLPAAVSRSRPRPERHLPSPLQHVRPVVCGAAGGEDVRRQAAAVLSTS